MQSLFNPNAMLYHYAYSGGRLLWYMKLITLSFGIKIKILQVQQTFGFHKEWGIP
jgi:hypothetical protein